jgi:light-regulated signal transduction histidine kinase (bacteriophytochrome)
MLERNNAQLAEANKDLEAFSDSVSHDLRAPLRHMSGFVEMLKTRLKDNPDEKAHSYADSISGASKKMGMLIDDLLAFSHIGRKEMQKKKLNLNVLVSGAVREIQDELKDRKIRWDIAELPDVLGDKSLLRLVIVNLVSNAVKFTSTRPLAEIRIGCKDEVDKFTCSIADNGVGFDMKYADRLFGVFQRLHTQEEFEGTGIGLANVQRIILRHGGRVWAESVVGQGATFYFTLPKIKKA